MQNITEHMQSFDLTVTTGWTGGEIKTDTNLDLMLDVEFESRSQPVTWEVKGRYWFDPWMVFTGTCSEVEIKENGAITAKLEGLGMVDKTNHGRLARFLRWLLRRN